MSDRDINLSSLLASQAHKFDLKLNNESPEDAVARRVEHAADAKQRRGMAWAIFIFAIIMVATIFVGCVVAFVSGGQDEKKWAAGIVSAMASGLIGFLVGQGKKQ